MNITYRNSLVWIFTLILCPQIVSAQFDTLTIPELLDELTLNSEMARAAETALTANRAMKEQHIRELAAINRETDNYNSVKAVYDTDLAGHNAEVTRYNAECGSGTFEQEGLNRCQSWEQRMNTAQNALNARLSALNSQRVALSQRMADYNRRERDRAQIAQQLLSQFDVHDLNIKTITALLSSQEIFRNSRPGCDRRPSPEAITQCMRTIWESRR